MESALLSVSSTSTMSILPLSKSLISNSTPLIAHLHRRYSTARSSQLAHLQLSRCSELVGFAPRYLVRGLNSVDRRRKTLQFAASYASQFASGGGDFGGVDGSGGGGGGGDGKADGGGAKPGAVAAGATDAAALSSDVIILDVGGMTCGGCAASVKRILESQPQVSSASVNLTTETAIIWPVSEATIAPNWQKDIGEALAKHLTSCGFASNLRDQEAIDGDIQS